MARLIRRSNDQSSTRKSKQSSSNSSRDLHSFVQSRDFPLRLPKLSAPSSPDPSIDVETVMLLSHTASMKLREGRPKPRALNLDTMVKPHYCDVPPSRGSPLIVRELPTDFQGLMQYQQRRVKDRTVQSGPSSPVNGYWAIPFNRKDAELLLKWLDDMLNKLVSKRDLSVSEIFTYAKGIYSVCLDETLLQIGVYCKEWGMVLERVWTAYLGLLEKAVEVAKVEIEVVETKSGKEQEKLRSKYAIDLEAERVRVADLSTKVSTLSKQVISLEMQLIEKDESEETLRGKNMLLQSAYEDTKVANFALKEEVRVLRTKLDDAIRHIQNEGKEMSPGKKVRAKTFAELKEGSG